VVGSSVGVDSPSHVTLPIKPVILFPDTVAVNVVVESAGLRVNTLPAKLLTVPVLFFVPGVNVNT